MADRLECLGTPISQSDCAPNVTIQLEKLEKFTQFRIESLKQQAVSLSAQCYFFYFYSNTLFHHYLLHKKILISKTLGI